LIPALKIIPGLPGIFASTTKTACTGKMLKTGGEKMGIKVTLSKVMMDTLRREAGKLEITPNVLARIQLCRIYNSSHPDAASKSYIIEMKNWRDIEAYVNERGFGDMGIFLGKAAEFYMRKNHLSDVQKAAAKENIEKC
jgi:hypothetical protein